MGLLTALNEITVKRVAEFSELTSESQEAVREYDDLERGGKVIVIFNINTSAMQIRFGLCSHENGIELTGVIQLFDAKRIFLEVVTSEVEDIEEEAEVFRFEPY